MLHGASKETASLLRASVSPYESLDQPLQGFFNDWYSLRHKIWFSLQTPPREQEYMRLGGRKWAYPHADEVTVAKDTQTHGKPEGRTPSCPPTGQRGVLKVLGKVPNKAVCFSTDNYVRSHSQH